MIKGNFNIKKIDPKKKDEMEELEEFVIKSGAVGSHMIFKCEKKNEEFFIGEL